MWRKQGQAGQFFTGLCEQYYPKILRYLYASLGDEGAARDCTQDVFLTALGKSELLMQHPNPGGFLMLTAKNLARKARRNTFAHMLHEDSLEGLEPPDTRLSVESLLDKAIDEHHYIETVLSRLSDEKRQLYQQRYQNGASYGEIAEAHGMQEAAVRMRFVRLRRELLAICHEVAEEFFGT